MQIGFDINQLMCDDIGSGATHLFSAKKET